MKLKLTEYQYSRLFEDNDTKSYKVLKNIFERRFDLSFPHSEGTSYEYDTLIKDKETNISYSEYEMDGITLPMIDLIEIISDLTGFDDNFIEIFLNKYIETEFEKKDYYGYNKLNEQEILSNKTYQVIKKIFERNFTLEYVTYDRNEEEIVYIINLNNDDGYSESEYNLNEFFDELGDLTGYNWKTIQAFYNAYLKDEMANNISRTVLEQIDKLTDKPYKILEKIFDRTYELELDPVYADTWDIKFKGTDDYTTRYAKNLQELSGFSKELVDDFLDSYVNDKINIKYKLKEQQTDKSYNVLKKYFNRHFNLMRDEYGTYVLYRDKDDEEDSTDFKFYVDEEGWYGVLADIQATTGFDKDTIENFIISYSDELYRNEEESLYEEKSDEKLKRLLIKLMKDKYGYYTRTGRLYDKEDDFTVNLNDIVSYLVRTTGYEKQHIFNMTKDFIDNKTNFINEEIKINRTPNLLNVKIIEGKEDIGEITFESSDGIEYTIIDAKIKPEFRNKGFYKKAIIDILKKYPDIKIVSIFRSDDADKAWNSLIEKLPPEFKVEKKEHEAEKTKEYKLSLNEGLDSDKRSKIIIKYLLQDFEPVMAIDPYKFTEKVIFFYKEDAEREEDYELYLWDNQSHIVTMVSIISNVTGYDRSIVHDVIQKYIKNINKHGLKSINEAEIDADGNLIDFDYEEETDAEFETSNFSFILDKVEDGEVYGDFTFKKIDLRFPIVMKPEGDSYRIGFPDDNIEQDFMGAANHFRLGKEYNQFIRHILNTLLK